MRYAVVIEKTDNNYGAYVPDLPGCGTTGGSVQEVLANIRQAIELHLDGMAADKETIPNPSSLVDYVDVKMPLPASAA
jgi:predicted RNase H-like HicB family nuclease